MNNNDMANDLYEFVQEFNFTHEASTAAWVEIEKVLRSGGDLTIVETWEAVRSALLGE